MNYILFIASFFYGIIALSELSINTTTRTLLLFYYLTLKFFSKRISKIFRLLSTISGINLQKTPNINE